MEDQNNLYDKPNTLLTMEEFLGKWEDNWNMNEGIIKLESYHGKLDYIKRYYEREENSIIDTFNKSINIFHNSYPLDWSLIFTPIESYAWNCIRIKGIVLYPQYPVLNYHLDFANPGLKIGLELDGVEFHNPEKDLIRDNKLRELGWTIYRITGKEMNRTHYENLESLKYSEFDEEEKRQLIRYWILETGDGIIEAIKTVHFKSNEDPFYKTDLGFNYFYFCNRTLFEHQSNYNG